MKSEQYKAIYHNDWLLSGKEQTREQWQKYANKIAQEETKKTNFAWHGVVAFIEHRNAFRISIGGQPT
jgi:hypothetical protein